MIIVVLNWQNFRLTSLINVKIADGKEKYCQKLFDRKRPLQRDD